jgi:carboxypeptidase T
MMRLSADETAKPAAVFMGGHHAREHVSVEIPLRLVGYLLDEYKKQNPRIVSLFNSYEIFIAPLMNPDGKEYDVASGNYRQWRKNRTKNSDNSYGVDLNRNYGYGWGGVGASTSTSSETYRGPNAFSELETQAIKGWIEQHPQVTMLLSYHTFSKLVLWPWGHLDETVSNQDDLLIFENMGKQMAQWTGYKPMKSGDLYLASGDTCDWAYGEHGIFAFTFELDPGSPWEGGFYPGYGIVDAVFKKNIEAALYLIESADNPAKRK